MTWGSRAGADSSVGGVVHAAERACNAVDRTELGVGQSHSAVQACQGHITPGLNIGTVSAGHGKRGKGTSESVYAELIRKRSAQAGDIRFHDLGQGVHAGQNGGCRGHGYGQLRINQRHLGQHAGTAQAHLQPMFRRTYDGIGCHFRTCACSGRYCDIGQRVRLQWFPPPADDFQVIDDAA